MSRGSRVESKATPSRDISPRQVPAVGIAALTQPFAFRRRDACAALYCLDARSSCRAPTTAKAVTVSVLSDQSIFAAMKQDGSFAVSADKAHGVALVFG